MKYCLFYGSLKSQEYNFDRFGDGTQKYIKTLELEGYELYDLGFYPGLVKGNGKITVELHEVSDLAFQAISHMEQGAGYKESKEKINLDNKEIEASLFYYEGNLMHRARIKSGNWTEEAFRK